MKIIVRGNFEIANFKVSLLVACQNKASEINQIEAGGQYFPMVAFITLWISTFYIYLTSQLVIIVSV